MAKSRKQCSVIVDGKFIPVKAHHVGLDVYDKKTREKIGVLIEQNPNTLMLRMKSIKGNVVTLK